jgi:hypothetical protein
MTRKTPEDQHRSAQTPAIDLGPADRSERHGLARHLEHAAAVVAPPIAGLN